MTVQTHLTLGIHIKRRPLCKANGRLIYLFIYLFLRLKNISCSEFLLVSFLRMPAIEGTEDFLAKSASDTAPGSTQMLWIKWKSKIQSE